MGIMFLFFAVVFVVGARGETRWTLFGFSIHPIIFWIFAIYSAFVGIVLLFFD